MKLLVARAIPVIHWIEADPLERPGDARRTDEFRIPARRMRVGHDGDQESLDVC